MKIILIGGGNLANKENKTIHKYMLDCCKTAKPRVLFISLSSNEKVFIDCMSSFNCEIKVFEKLSDIDNCDIIYIGGGNTEEFLKRKDLIKKIYENIDNKIISGISAGAIFWFEKYYSDTNAFNYKDTTINFQLKNGIGFFKGFCCPHYNHNGKEAFNDLVNNNFALALDDNTALVIDDEKIDYIYEKKANAIYYFNRNVLKVLNEENKSELFSLIKEGQKKIS